MSTAPQLLSETEKKKREESVKAVFEKEEDDLKKHESRSRELIPPLVASVKDLEKRFKEGKITREKYDELSEPKREKIREIDREYYEAYAASHKEFIDLRSGGNLKKETEARATSDFEDLKKRRSAATAAGKPPVYSGGYIPDHYKRRRFTKRHATSRYTGKVRSRKHVDVNDALQYKLLCRKLRNFNELLTKLRKKSEKIYLKLKKHKKATASDFVILAKLKRLEIKSNKQLHAKR